MMRGLLGPAAAQLSVHWVVGLEQQRRQGRLVCCDSLAPRRLSNELLGIPLMRSYRHVHASLPAFPRIWQTMRILLRRWRAGPTYYPLRMAMLLATLEAYVPLAGRQERVLTIGDGQGVFGALLKACHPRLRLTSVDLPPLLQAQRRLHGAAGIDATYCRPEDIDTLPPHVLAVSSACFPELTPQSRAAYFALLRQWGATFYCVGRWEKRLADGTVNRFADYPWAAQDQVLLDGPCPYYTHWFAWRWPFCRHFEGTGLMWHRVARLAPVAVDAAERIAQVGMLKEAE